MRRPVAVGNHVYLRRPSRADTGAYLAAAAASRHLHEPWIELPSTEPEFRSLLARGRRADVEQFLIVRRHDEELAGFVNLNNIIAGNLQTAFAGYGAFVPHDGRGAMTEGLELVLHLAFSSLGLHRIEANLQPGNDRSRRLAQRCGFRLEGYSPRYLRIAGDWRDHERWAVTAEDWRTHRVSSPGVTSP